MPNFLSSTWNHIYEAFTGPKTVDEEFDLKLEECKMVERNIHNIQRLFREHSLKVSGMREWLVDFYSSIGAIYDNNSPLYPVVNEILLVHQELERLLFRLSENINTINLASNEWDKYFAEVRGHQKLRIEHRFVYDHYDRKMERLVQRRNKMISKGKEAESPRFVKLFERNDLKYRSAAENFGKVSMYIYQRMCDLLDYKTKFVNPILIQLVNQEVQYYNACAQLMSRLTNIQQRFMEVEGQVQRQPITYDPFKYIRGRNLVGKIDLFNYNPHDISLIDTKRSLLQTNVESGANLFPQLNNVKPLETGMTSSILTQPLGTTYQPGFTTGTIFTQPITSGITGLNQPLTTTGTTITQQPITTTTGTITTGTIQPIRLTETTGTIQQPTTTTQPLEYSEEEDLAEFENEEEEERALHEGIKQIRLNEEDIGQQKVINVPLDKDSQLNIKIKVDDELKNQTNLTNQQQLPQTISSTTTQGPNITSSQHYDFTGDIKTPLQQSTGNNLNAQNVATQSSNVQNI